MRISAAGSNAYQGFTLLELLVVVAIMAIATAGVGLALRDSSQTMLEREAQRLVALLESARAQSRMTANPIRWRTTERGFSFEGATPASLPAAWLGADVRAVTTNPVLLGPEPIITPQRIQLATLSSPGHSLIIATDGVRPFAIAPAADVPTVAP